MTMIRMLVATVTASLAATVSHNIALQQYLTTRFVTVSHNIALQQYLTTRLRHSVSHRFTTVSHRYQMAESHNIPNGRISQQSPKTLVFYILLL